MKNNAEALSLQEKIVAPTIQYAVWNHQFTIGGQLKPQVARKMQNNVILIKDVVANRMDWTKTFCQIVLHAPYKSLLERQLFFNVLHHKNNYNINESIIRRLKFGNAISTHVDSFRYTIFLSELLYKCNALRNTSSDRCTCINLGDNVA